MTLRRSRPLVFLLAVLAAVSVLAGCGDDESPSTSGGDNASEHGAALEHIHGLGVSAEDGRLFIATHNGLFSVAPGETTPQKVGESSQDIMGFSIVDAKHFIASGHPAEGQDLPPHLGLIESRDAGKSWKNVSLLGEADFHVLEASGEKIYGFDGTQRRLMVSADGGHHWQQRKPPAGVFGLAVDPTDSDRVVASTERGLFVSANAGRAWRERRNDVVGLLAWPKEDRLYLVGGEGRVLVSPDAGASWQTQGTIEAQPAAFVAHDDELYAALADGTVKRSTDGGATWTVHSTA